MLDYQKIYRIPIGDKIIGKDYLTVDQAQEVISDAVVIEEKIDGKTDSKDMGDHVVFGEFMKWKHSIAYDRLPDWFIAFDVYDKQNEIFLDYEQKSKLLMEWGMSQTPLIFSGKINKLEELTRFLIKSEFADDQHAEGIVIKNYKKQKFAKLVRIEFLEGITDHWMTKKKIMNRLTITRS